MQAKKWLTSALILSLVSAYPVTALAEGTPPTTTTTTTTSAPTATTPPSTTTSPSSTTSTPTTNTSMGATADSQMQNDPTARGAAALDALLKSGNVPTEFTAAIDAAVAVMKAQATVGAVGKSSSPAPELITALANLQAMIDSGKLSAEAKAECEKVVADVRAQYPADSLTATGSVAGAAVSPSGTSAVSSSAPQTTTGTGSPSDFGARTVGEAQAAVADHLKSMLSAGFISNETASANVAEVIAKLTDSLRSSGKAASEGEALAEVEAALAAKGAAKTAAELDVLAGVQERQGKRAEAMGTLKQRLEANPTTKAAYEKFIQMDAEAGTKRDLDTYVAGRKVSFDVRPQVKEGRTLMPIRALVEALGATVSWDPATRTVTIVRGAKEVKISIGSRVATVGSAEVSMDVAAEIQDGRTLIPVRFVSEGLGLNVTWLADSRSIVVTEQPVK